MAQGLTRLIGAFTVALGLLTLSVLANAQSTTPHTVEKSCGAPGQAACPPPPVNVTPWVYYADPGYNRNYPPFSSLAEIDSYVRNDFTGGATGWCTETLTSTVTDATTLQRGILVGQWFTLNYDVTGMKPPDPSNCGNSWTTSTNVQATRSASCPAHLELIYQANPLIGPACGQPSQPVPNVQKQIGPSCNGGCPSGSSSSNSGAASPGSANTTIADPVNVSSGNNYREEVDYAGSGANALRFVRSYNSLEGNYAATRGGVGSPEFIWSFVGAGWRASYFQSLTPVTINDTNGVHSAVYATRPDGQVLIFVLSGGVYTPDADVGDSLVQTASGWAYQTQDDVIEMYTADGQLTSITRRGQSPITVNYAIPGEPPVSVSDSFGHTLQFTYSWDSNKHRVLASVTDPAGLNIQYTYDTNDNLSTVTYPDGTSRVYGYGTSDTAHSLTTLTDEAGVVYASWNYLLGDKVTSSQLAGGVEAYTYSYSYAYLGIPNGTVTVTDPLGKVRHYGQSLMLGTYHMASADTPCPDCDASRAFDGNGNITSRTDFNGHTTTYSYDTLNNLETSRTEAAGTAQARTITTTWNPSWRQPDAITEANRTTSFTYDTSGNTLTRTIADTSVTPNVTRTWTYTYNDYGQVLTADGPRTDISDLTTYTYYTCTTGYECGQIHTITNAANQITTFNTYNAHGQPLTITDPNGVLTTLTYDARQRLKSRQTAGETTAFDYWPTGLLKKVTLPDASFLAYTYDDAHRLTQITDALGNNFVYTLDAMGNRKAENSYDPANALHRTHTRVFNTLNQLWKDVNAAGTAAVTTTFGYDAQGNQKTSAAPLARNTTNDYDELNRLKQITDPAGGLTQFGYDANDNLTSVTDPRSLVTSYQYNGFGDLNAQSSPDTGTTTNTYDSAGNLATATDARGATSTYTYDTLNRVTSVAYSRSGTTDQTISFTYDTGTNGKGHLTGASDANHTLAWSYDALGRVTAKSQTVGSVTKSVGYAYTNSNLTTLTTPSGQTVTYGYNGNHQVTSVAVNGTPVLNSVTYEPLGPLSGWTWGNSTTTTRTYDTDGKISQIVSAGTKTYSYDDAFRITGLTDTSPGAANWTYGYDTLDRLTSGTSPTVTRGWTYDANGNRQTETGTTASTYSIAPSSNRITGITGALARTYAYDAAGNTTGYSTVTASYNNAGRLKTLTNGSSTETSTYNALGQRIRISGGVNGTVLYSYDEAGHLLGEYDGTGTLIEETIWLGDIPVATLKPSGASVALFYIHSDGLNTPRQITRPSDNSPMWTWNSDPFGTDAANPNPTGAGTFAYNLRFPGQVFDGEAGLHYNNFRDYDPASGRYVQSDPIGLVGGIDPYAYGGANPTTNVDPAGLQSASVRPGIPIIFPPIAIPGSAENEDWARNAAMQVENGMGWGLFPPADSTTVAPSCPNGEDPCAGLRAILREHEQKLADYLHNPILADNKGILSAAYLLGLVDRYWSIYMGRIASLRSQVENFKRLLAECEAKNGKR